MRLHHDSGTIYAGRTPVARVEPGKAAQVLAGRGFRSGVAQAIAHGALQSATETRALARQAGLLTIAAVDEARAKGLVQ